MFTSESDVLPGEDTVREWLEDHPIISKIFVALSHLPKPTEILNLVAACLQQQTDVPPVLTNALFRNGALKLVHPRYRQNVKQALELAQSNFPRFLLSICGR